MERGGNWESCGWEVKCRVSVRVRARKRQLVFVYCFEGLWDKFRGTAVTDSNMVGTSRRLAPGIARQVADSPMRDWILSSLSHYALTLVFWGGRIFG